MRPFFLFLTLLIGGVRIIPVSAQDLSTGRPAGGLRTAVERVLPSVVTIETRTMKSDPGIPGAKKRPVEETGIGIALRCENKVVIVTNYHVVAGTAPDTIRLTLHDRRFFGATRAVGNEEFDIAVIETDADVPPAPCGDSDRVEIADAVLAIGSPFGLKESVSGGMICAKNRRSIPSGNHQMPLQSFFQTDAAINPGNSGGPLLATDGKVIGMVTAIASTSGASEGVAFAIPINSVLRIAAQLVKSGVVTRPYLGVELDPAFDAKAHIDAGLDRLIGTRILAVQRNSPAENAGLQSGDIVLMYNGTEIEDNLHLVQLVALSDEDDTPEIVVRRGDAEYACRPKLAVQISR